MVVFLGSNPSHSSPHPIPFWYGTKSANTLISWFERVGKGNLPNFRYMNVCDLPTENNRPLTVKEIKENLPALKAKLEAIGATKIVAVGKTAEKAMTLLRLDCYSMPHPSGLNRQLNDEKFVEKKINGLRDYLRPSKIE